MLLGLIAFTQLGKVLIFLVTLSILVVLHEYGHFLVARRNRVRVNEFAVGMGPKLAGWKSPRSGTLYSLRALPIGGYCAMEGEDGKTSEAEQQREFRQALQTESPEQRKSEQEGNFQAKTPWQRLAIVVAGPAANFLLAYIILLTGALAFGVAGNTPQAIIGPVLSGSPAAKAGLHPGDRIVQINGVQITNGTQMVDRIHNSLGKPLDIEYLRDGVRYKATITPMPCPLPGNPKQGCIGFNPVDAYQHVGFIDAVKSSASDFVSAAYQTVGSLALLVTHFKQYAGQVSGPIGMGQAAVTVQDFGWGAYFRLAALISFALGIFNLLPLPALDGGRGAFIIAELIRGKPVDPEKEAFVHVAGLAALLALMVVIAFHDVARIIGGHGIFN